MLGLGWSLGPKADASTAEEYVETRGLRALGA